MKSINKPFAVVTGASSGIGFALAEEFLRNGYHVLGIAEDEAVYNVGSVTAHNDYEGFQADLRTKEGVEEAWARIKAAQVPVDAICLNAGVGVGGAFVDTDIEREVDMINLNVTSTVRLAKKIVPEMKLRGAGKILITASVASVMPAPFMAVYAATKAFDLSFADGLRNELKDTGVTVTALMPGETDTNFFHRADMEDTKVGQKEKDDPADVAKRGFKAMMDGESHIVGASFSTWAMGHMAEFLPESVKAEMHRHLTEPGSARK